MKGYAKINANHPLAQRSTSKKEYAFLDGDVDLRRKQSFMQNNKNETIMNDQLPSTIDDHDEKNKKKIQLFLEKLHDLEKHEPRKNDPEMNSNSNAVGGGGILRRNFSVSSTISNHKNKGKMVNNFQHIDTQGSSKSIQGMVRRSFSLRKSTSVSGSSDRYCRIYDQPMRVDDNENNGFDNDLERSNNNGENNRKSRGKMKVGSKVVKACKRLFSIS